MTANKRIADLSDYTSLLPYASELFGVYQPLIGWRSKRQQRRIRNGILLDRRAKLVDLARRFAGHAEVLFNSDYQLEGARLQIGTPKGPQLWSGQADSLFLAMLADRLKEAGDPADDDMLRDFFSDDRLSELLNTSVAAAYKTEYERQWHAAAGQEGFVASSLQSTFTRQLQEESAVAGVLSALAARGKFNDLRAIFFSDELGSRDLGEVLDTLPDDYDDPYLTFDPTKQLEDVTLSPLGIVHLFRQYFFELDTFLGTPVSHVWLSPGSTVELLEVSTRRTLVEKTVENALETTSKSERSTTESDEISEAVKQDNRDDTKLGFSATVNQSWGTGSATASANLDMNKTQQIARENGHKRSREQTEKLSTEIRQSYKSTFKTVTETVDTSTKRYLLNNTTPKLINYELRRKMRQVGVQIQDVGTYLCWQTFVDDPGDALALPNLIHVAKPADLVDVPKFQEIAMPPEWMDVTFTGQAVWNFPDNARQWSQNHPEQIVPIATLDITGVPTDYEVFRDPANPYLEIQKTVVAADDDESWNAVNWDFRGVITTDNKRVTVGVVTSNAGLAWNDRITFNVSGGVRCRLRDTKRDEIAKANSTLMTKIVEANAENARKLEESYVNAARDRVTLASTVTKRSFDHLREEERSIVYRNLIQMLMSEQRYTDKSTSKESRQLRHVLSELIISIFDIDKMLYFVAPEWWRPRRSTAALVVPGGTSTTTINGSVVSWAADENHSKYFITDKSEPAPLGASLGWLLQLDGDDLRNAFLNAPWVKAVIPIRPGKERAAMQWLQAVNVEGADGLDAVYAAPQDELDEIRVALLAKDADDPVKDHAQITIDDAIRNLCNTVHEKHQKSMQVGRYPEDEINDDNRVSATPLEKVYEHGFYPLKEGFRAKTERPFEITSQWIEVLPTDQVVPVEVEYDPKTGRQN